jgi:hypothetical protein
MARKTTIEIANDTLDELRAIGTDYNKVIKDLIHEHNCNLLLEAGERLISEKHKEFVSIDDL